MADPVTDEAEEIIPDEADSDDADEAAEDVGATEDAENEDVEAAEDAPLGDVDAKLVATLRQVAVAAAVSALTPIVKEVVTKAAENAVRRAPEMLENAGGVQGLSDLARGRIEEAGGMSAFMTQTRERFRRRRP